MHRIEKTQLNKSAMLILLSTLREVKSENVIEISTVGRNPLISTRLKEEHEKKIFSTDLTFLEELFRSTVTGDARAIILDEEGEKYLRHCSYAANYYTNELGDRIEKDSLDIFHEIHFTSPNSIDIDELLSQFCSLFKIDLSKCSQFLNSTKIKNGTIELPAKNKLHQIFQRITICDNGELKQMILESHNLEMMESLEAMFCIKDLLYCNGFDVTVIPEFQWFGAQIDEEITYSFTTIPDFEILISFKYERVKVSFMKK